MVVDTSCLRFSLTRSGEIEIRFYSLRAPNGETMSIDGGVITNNGTSILKGDTYKMDVVKGVGIALLGTGLGAVGGTAGVVVRTRVAEQQK